MPPGNNRVGNDDTAANIQALVDSLMKVVACYHHFSWCVGGSTDSLQLRHQLQQTREKAQKLSAAICHHLTFHLRDKSLPQEQRREMELLWVVFSSSLELLHVDMCKVFTISGIFSPADPVSLVQTGLQGGGSEVAARALSLPDLNQVQTQALPAGLEMEERSALEEEIGHIDRMMEDMEAKVNVLRWMVEPRRPQYADPISSADSMALVSVDEEQPGSTSQPQSQRSHIFVLVLLFTVIVVAAILSVCVFIFS
ncbi:regulator of G-protein signaling 9-binding protein [Austrofundulus limnaeus]|uniref:Regulator of G-protein signaling 9-binding protein n=1 Tax=Austrofundulus limnaeus TaxID=52670 RepID=A0A2I4B6A6_AUSLI|nr:PREDICTED: regulator of G-protein signaling 9-binding protein-like [Austrofundulus limnaeus]